MKQLWIFLIFTTSWYSALGQSVNQYQHARQIAASDNSSVLWHTSALYSNPAAALHESKPWGFDASAGNRFQTDIWSFSGALSKKLNDRNGIGLVVGNYGIEGFKESNISLSYTRALHTNTFLALQAHYYQLNIEGLGQTGTPDFSLGFWHKSNDRWILSAFVKNPMQLRKDEPTRPGKVDISLALIISDQLQIFGAVDKKWNETVAFRPGLRYQPSEIMILYISTSTAPNTYGFGVDLKVADRLNTTLGLRTHPILGNSMSLSLGYHL